MRTVTWLIQTNLVDIQQQLDVRKYALAAGARVKEVVVIPMEDSIQLPVSLNAFEDGVIIPYGSTSLVKRIHVLNELCDGYPAFRGLCYDTETFRVDRWIKERDDLLNSDITVARVDQLHNYLLDENPDSYWFIRPLSDLKVFQGMCAQLREIRQWKTSKESRSFQIEDDTLVVIAEAKQILAEYRYFIVGGTVISGSRYHPGGRKLPERVIDFERLTNAQLMANAWLPHENCVMDLADTEDGLKVIEFNCINAAGFYNHDINAVVEALTRYYQYRPSKSEEG